MAIPYTLPLPGLSTPQEMPVAERLRRLQKAADANGMDLPALLAGRDPGAFTQAEWGEMERAVIRRNNPF